MAEFSLTHRSFHFGGLSRWAVRIAVLASPLLLMGADSGCVSRPTPDTIVTTGTVKIQGNIMELDSSGEFVALHDGKVTLNVNGTNLASVTTVNKEWTYASVALKVGINRIKGTTSRSQGGTTINGTIPEFVLERRTDLSATGEQKVFLDWSDAGTADILKDIAKLSLSPTPSAADLDAFAANVKDGIKIFVENAYKGTNVTIVGSTGPNVHVIKFVGTSYSTCGLYGQSPGDFKNTIKAQTSKVYLNSFKCQAQPLTPGGTDSPLLTKTPARSTDTLAQRVRDISVFIGRTAAHEFGHSLGLTEEGEAGLHGCEGMHNCLTYEGGLPVDRFDDGHYMMDPGPRSKLYARIGQAHSGETSSTGRKEKLPRFDAYGLSYLKIVLQ